MCVVCVWSSGECWVSFYHSPSIITPPFFMRSFSLSLDPQDRHLHIISLWGKIFRQTIIRLNLNQRDVCMCVWNDGRVFHYTGERLIPLIGWMERAREGRMKHFIYSTHQSEITILLRASLYQYICSSLGHYSSMGYASSLSLSHSLSLPGQQWSCVKVCVTWCFHPPITHLSEHKHKPTTHHTHHTHNTTHTHANKHSPNSRTH